MNRIDPMVMWLSALFVFCVVVTMTVGIMSPNDSVIFTWAAGLSTGVLGMIGLRIRPSRSDSGDESKTTTTTTSKTENPPQ